MQRFSIFKQMVHIVTNMLERVKKLEDDDDGDENEEDNDAEKPDTQK
jgi:hypothetical protein